MKKEYAIALRNINYFFKTADFKTAFKRIKALEESLKKTNPKLYSKYQMDFFYWFENKKRMGENLLIKSMLISSAEKREFNSREVILVLANFIIENLEAIQKEFQNTHSEELAQ